MLVAVGVAVRVFVAAPEPVGVTVAAPDPDGVGVGVGVGVGAPLGVDVGVSLGAAHTVMPIAVSVEVMGAPLGYSTRTENASTMNSVALSRGSTASSRGFANFACSGSPQSPKLELELRTPVPARRVNTPPYTPHTKL